MEFLSPVLPSDPVDGEGAGSAGPTFLLYILRITGSEGIGMSLCVSIFEFLKFFIFLERALAKEGNR